MRSRAFLLEAHHTTHIEGTRLTLDEAARVLKGEEVPGADPDDARELLNYRRAFEFVSTCFNEGTPIMERLIRENHRQLVDGVRGGAAAPGEYRRVQNYVVNSATGETIYTPPPAGEVPDLMRALVAWLNDHRWPSSWVPSPRMKVPTGPWHQSAIANGSHMPCVKNQAVAAPQAAHSPRCPILVGGSVIMENIFVLPGLGRLMLNALENPDYPVVSGINLLFGTAVVVGNMLIDLAYAFLDPRIRYE